VSSTNLGSSLLHRFHHACFAILDLKPQLEAFEFLLVAPADLSLPDGDAGLLERAKLKDKGGETGLRIGDDVIRGQILQVHRIDELELQIGKTRCEDVRGGHHAVTIDLTEHDRVALGHAGIQLRQFGNEMTQRSLTGIAFKEADGQFAIVGRVAGGESETEGGKKSSSAGHDGVHGMEYAAWQRAAARHAARLMFDIREKPNMVERAFLIGAYFDRREKQAASDLLDELRELVGTLGIEVIGCELVYAREHTARYLIGSGKSAELMKQAKDIGADCIVWDNELSPGQQRAWESEGNICVIDRHEVILDIFNMRAKTREARLQVELARMEYSIPRLTRMWAHLDRQGGGAGGGQGGAGAARGEGETQLEVDRRLASKRLDKLRADLEEVKKQRDTMRKERSRVPVPHAAIVGYTNAGKSSLLNKLTAADAYVENKLFATLDTTTRRMELPDGQPLLVTDTVGFIRNLPHDLVQSFRATLEEANQADFLVHVIDASSTHALEFYQTTTKVLAELGAGDKKVLLVLNKVDLIDDPRLLELKREFPEAVTISVKTGQGMDDLLHRLHDFMIDRVVRLTLSLPLDRMDLVALAHQEGKVLSEDYETGRAEIQCVIPKRFESRFAAFLPANPELDGRKRGKK
jgi:GTP-binding protein HflX